MFQSHSDDQTKAVAKSLAPTLQDGDVLRLYGEMGVGKTAFVQGLAAALGVSTVVSSPTFALMNIHEGRLTLYHFDLYRLHSQEELFEAGLDEYIGQSGITVIEWPTFSESIVGGRNIRITISRVAGMDENCREICVEGMDDL